VLNNLANILNTEEELAKIFVRIEPAKMITDITGDDANDLEFICVL
jgi:hypothetical protein